MITWLYPKRCPICLRIATPWGAVLHVECKQKLDAIKGPVCLKCGMPLSSEEKEYCEVCMCLTDRGFNQGRSIFPYHGAIGNALWLLKKDGRTEIVHFFAEQMLKNQRFFIQQVAPDCIVPVPLHPSKRRKRGFNQAELLALALGEKTNIPVRLLLKKKKKTKDQKNLSKNQRIKNVADAFAVNENALGENIPESVLLLDDVSTTGSTLTACAKALKASGVSRVAFLTVCVAEQQE